MAFTALHWIAPGCATPAAALLRKEGHLAVVTTSHVLPRDGDPFFAAVQEDDLALGPDPSNGPPPDPAAVGDKSGEIAAARAFRAVVRRYR